MKTFYVMVKTLGTDDYSYLCKDDAYVAFDTKEEAENHIDDVLVKETDVFPQGTFFAVGEIRKGKAKEKLDVGGNDYPSNQSSSLN